MSQFTSQAIDIPFQKSIAQVAINYYELALKHSERLHHYRSPKSDHQISPNDRRLAIMGRRTNDIFTWVSRISQSPDPKEALHQYATNHIAWALDEFKNLPEIAKNLRRMIQETMGDEFIKKMDQVPL